MGMPGAMSPNPPLLRDADDAAQARHVAAAIAHILERALNERARASLVLSGGSTPLAMYAVLAQHALDWARVDVTLADERWVAIDDPDSNEGHVRAALLRSHGSKAHFVGLKNNAPDPAAGAASAWAALSTMPRPFDAVLLGMGDDGHTASLFPGSAEASGALDPEARPGCVAAIAGAPAHARLTLNLSALLQSRQILIQIAGESKWQAYEKASRAGAIGEMPVRAILRQQQVPVRVFWCP